MLLLRPRSTLEGPVQNERGGALGIGSREERTHLAPVSCAEEHRLLRADRIEHRPSVLHVRLERRSDPWPVGSAEAAPVEEDQPREARQPIAELAEHGQ